MAGVEQLVPSVGVAEACRTLGVARSRVYRARQRSQTAPAHPPRPSPARALDATEREHVREVLNSERFQDCAPRAVYATLLDEGTYLCSWRTMDRLLDEHAEVQERRNQVRPPAYQQPELLATGPNQLWSWDMLQAQRTGDLDLRVCLRHVGCVQSLQCRVDDHGARVRPACGGIDCGYVCPGRDATRPTDAACGSGECDDLENRGALAG